MDHYNLIMCNVFGTYHAHSTYKDFVDLEKCRPLQSVKFFVPTKLSIFLQRQSKVNNTVVSSIRICMTFRHCLSKCRPE